jgi:hypothetical protein
MTEIVSLGNACGIAYQLKKYGLRKTAYPFDWLKIMKWEDLNRLIEDEFESFFRGENFKFKYFSEKFPQEDGGSTYIYENNGILFCHDFTKNFEESYKKFINKYSRRIYRLYDLIQSDKKIHFIRDELKYYTGIEKDISKFIDIIYGINPYCNFKLSLIINNYKNKDIKLNDNIIIDDNLNLIIDNNSIGNWTRPNINWQYIFETENKGNENINIQNFLSL